MGLAQFRTLADEASMLRLYSLPSKGGFLWANAAPERRGVYVHVRTGALDLPVRTCSYTYCMDGKALVGLLG